MKIKPEILLNNNDEFLYNKILVSGSDETFINYTIEYIVKIFKNKNYFVDSSGSYSGEITGDLFSDKKVLFVVKDYSSKNNNVEKSNLINHSILIISPNGKRNNIAIKNELTKSKDGLVIECYPLSRKSKELILRKYMDDKSLNLSNDIFWYIVENFDDRYVFFIKQLETLSLLGVKINTIDVVEKTVFIDNKIDLSRIFFHIFKSNKYLINIFNKNVYSQTDFYIFLNSLKSYLEIISYSKSQEGALSKFPRYLFGEKDVFIKIYNKLNRNKILKIYKNISKVESLVRKNKGLFNIIGLRFLLSTKKIITS